MPYNVPKRAIITTKDIMRILGIGECCARKLLSTIRIALGKSSNKFVTVKDFAEYTKIELEEIMPYIP